MKCQLIDEEFPLVESGPPRTTDRAHVSQIVRGLVALTDGVKEDDDPREGDPGLWSRLKVRFGIGFIWEELLSMAYAWMCGNRPGEFELDGIVGSPDGIDWTGDVPVVEEYKCTWKSSCRSGTKDPNPPTDNLRYMLQVKAYCRMVETTRARMRILHVNGNYRDREPVYRVWEIDFTPLEIAENWEMMVNYARAKGLIFTPVTDAEIVE